MGQRNTTIATIGIDLEMPTGRAIAEMQRFGGVVDSTTAAALRHWNQVEAATQQIGNMDRAIVGMGHYAGEVERTALEFAKAADKAERNGERIVRDLEKQIALYGLTRQEVRALRSEEAARAADAVGKTELAGNIRAAEMRLATKEMNTLRRVMDDGSDAYAASMQRNSFATRQFAMQLPDIIGGLLSGQKPMQVFIQQGGQIAQVAQMAEGGTRGFAKEIGLLGLRFVPLGIAAAAAGTMLFALNERMEKDSGLKAYSESLGLTKDEMKKLGDVSVTAGDMMRGFFTTIGVDLDGVGGTIKGWVVGIGEFFGNVTKGIGAATYGLFVGSYRAIVETWRQFPAVLGDLFVKAVNGAIGALEWLTNKGVDAVNALGGSLEHVEFGRMDNKFAGAGAAAGEAWSRNLNGAVKEGLDGVDQFMGDWTKNSQAAARDRLKADAAKIIADRTDKAPKTDKHAEQLAREAAAIEAQIQGLRALAAAYDVSGAAALIAEARVKAETQAIRGNNKEIEEAIARHLRLVLAQRTADAARGAAGMREEAEVRRQVNSEVAAGLVPLSRANDLVRDRIADLPLLHALEAANAKGLVTAAADITRALAGQREARKALAAQEDAARAQDAMKAGRDQLAMIELEGRLIGATTMERVRSIATLRAEQEARASGYGPDWVRDQVAAAVATEANGAALDRFNNLLPDSENAVRSYAAAFGDAFGGIGEAVGLATAALVDHGAEQRRIAAAVANGQMTMARASDLSANAQIDAFAGITGAARSMFSERSAIYKGLMAAETVMRAAQLAMSIQRMIADTTETVSTVANAGIRSTAHATEGVAAQSKLPFPANLAAMAATAAALVGVGVAILGGIGGGGKNDLPAANTGTGTVLGDPAAQSESLRRGIDALRDVDVLMLNASRQMAGYLRSIDNQIGGFAAQILRAGDVGASAGVTEGFKRDMIGSVVGAIPLIGGFLGSLFGSKTTVVGGGLYGGAQSVGDILDSGYDASTYADIQKKKKFFGLTTSTKYSTQYGEADAGLENQFALILRGFASAIGAAAGPLGEATDAVESRLRGFVVDIGRVDLKGLTGDQVTEKLEAIFGAAADGMAAATFPGIARFQAAGEGMFETLVRVSSTVEAVTSSFQMLGRGGIGIDASVALADLFDTVGDLTTAQQGYFDAYYTAAEQAAARTAQMERALGSLGVAMPATLAGFRGLVEAQDLATAAGRETYATLIQLAPAFADLQSAMGGAKSAADIMAERQGLERKLLEIAGDEAAIRALDLAKLDASNRALQEQVWAAEAARDAAKAADELRQAWKGVGDTIMDEVRRIRGLDAAQGPAGFAGLMGQFGAITAAARAGDMDAAKQLPALSRSLLDAAAKAATSRQELDRVQAEAAASLEASYAAIAGYGNEDAVSASAERSAAAMAQAATAATATATATGGVVEELRGLRKELEEYQRENSYNGRAAAEGSRRTSQLLDRVIGYAGGNTIAVTSYRD